MERLRGKSNMPERHASRDGGVGRRVSINAHSGEKIKSAAAPSGKNSHPRQKQLDLFEQIDEPERGTGPVRTTQEEQNPGKNAPKQPGEKCKNATPKKKAQTDAETGATPNERGKSQKQATPPLYNWRDSEKEISTERGQNGVESDQTPILDPEITADRDAPSVISVRFWVYNAPSTLICSADVRDAILFYHPDAATDDRLFRWIVMQGMHPWIDHETRRPLVSRPQMEYVWGENLRHAGTNARGVLEWLDTETTLGSVRWAGWIPEERCRTLYTDGIHPDLKAIITEDLQRPPEAMRDPVHVLTGKPVGKNDPSRIRKAWKDRLPEEAGRAPSETARTIWQHMNSVSARTLSPITDRVPEAIEAVCAYPYRIERKAGESTRQHEARAAPIRRCLRRYHLSVLRTIAVQPKPFYKFSGTGRTDRIFGWNRSALDLPSRIRKTLFAGYHEIDLASAHLCIASCLWGADGVRSRLENPDYSVWADILDGLYPAMRGAYTPERYDDVKGALKVGLYSTVYGMKASSVHGETALALCRALEDRDAGVAAGRAFMQHPVVSELLSARDAQLAAIEAKGGAEAADGRFIPLPPEHKNPEASVLATVAQSYEQALMKVLVEYENERGRSTRFRLALWLHDGCYVRCSRRMSARMKDLNRRLDARADELGVIARFDHEELHHEELQPNA